VTSEISKKTMFNRLKAEDERIHNFGRNAEIGNFGRNAEIGIIWPDESDNDASVSFRDMFENEDSFFEALNGEVDDDYFAPSFP
jgi:hypothetical protein